MKKVFALMAIVGLFSVVACGPAKENNEEAEKLRIEDSIRVADSIAAAEAAAAQTEPEVEVTDDSTSTEGAEVPATTEESAS